jgi:hypothetical protein
MSGTAEGALRAAASRTGHSVTEYLDCLNAGLRWCFRDQAWEPTERFGRDASRSDGLARSCRRSRNAYGRNRYAPKGRPPIGRRYVDARDGDYRQARRRVNYLVSAGLMPPANAAPCVDCGHEWESGQRRHEYDHYKGYSPAHHEDVESVCTTCHHIREEARRKAESNGRYHEN